MSIASPITHTATSTYAGSTVPLPIARSQSNVDNIGGLTIIKEGWASVKENKNLLQTWRQKYMILRKDAMDFHKTEGGKSSYTIVLKDVIGVSRVETNGIVFEIKRHASGTSTAPGDLEDGNTKVLQIKVKSDDDLYQWIDFIYARCPGMGGVSNPINFSHQVHVGFDPVTGEFTGLPTEWSKLLNSSAITKEDYERNPQAVFEVLNFYTDIKKREKEPENYSSLTPTPPAISAHNKQLGYNVGGSSIAPPRPTMNGQRNNSYGNLPSAGGVVRTQTPPDQQMQVQQMRQMAAQFKPDTSRDDQRMKEEQQRQRERDQRERERAERSERERREQEEYNASLPKTRQPLVQQEVGGGGYSAGPSDRYNPSRAAPPAPGTPRQQGPPPGSLRAQRPAPSAPTSLGGPRPGLVSQNSSSSLPQSGGQQSGRSSPRTDAATGQRSESPRYQNGANGTSHASQSRGPQPQNGQPRSQPASVMQGPVAQVKPLNVAKQTTNGPPVSNGIQQNDAVKAAEAALTSKPPTTERQKDVRMSTMSENEVMARLKDAVSKDDPAMSYSKQKKIGQGASGSVYVAKVKENPLSPIARQVLREQGSKAQVAIKQMDLAHQPRKELIVNEIMVMKDSKHRNIVNFLDAFLRNNFTELWVVMEYMEGGALTDVIDNNPVITEDQISTICLEARTVLPLAELYADFS
jgi:protein-serine/threonine kinase